MMQLNVETLEDIPKPLQKLYTASDSGFILDVEGLEDTTGLKSALQKERDNNKGLKLDLKTLRTDADDVEKARLKAEADALEKTGDLDKIKENLSKHYQGDIDALIKKVSARDQKLERVLLRDEANRIASEIAVDTDSIPVLAEWIKHRIGIEEKDGEFNVIVTGESSGLSMKEFIEGLTQQKPLARLLKASNGTGGGASGDTSGGTANTKGNMGGSKAERLVAIKERLAQAG